MRYNVHHRTTYRYGEAVDLSYHALRLTPRASERQRVGECTIITSPPASRLDTPRDYFGNAVSYLTIDEPHDHLVIDARAQVEVFPREAPRSAGASFVDLAAFLAGGSSGAIEAGEFTHASPYVPLEAQAAELSRDCAAPGRDVLEAVLEISTRIHRGFVFDPSATAIATPLAEVLRLRRGVCQDFAHVMLAALRAIGVPARYMSGYIRTYPAPGQDRRFGADASHAWVGVFVPTLGWIEIDPTNDLVVGDEHVVLGWGRDYGDVSPVRGVVLGGGPHQLDVAVDLAPAP